MSNTIGSTKDLDTTRQQALRGLLSSLGRAKDDPSSNGKLSAEQVQKLSERINEILGDGADSTPTQGDKPSQLLNEEGPPIVDITEPIREDSRSSPPPSFIAEPDFIPLSLLPPDEMERRRHERDRILDLLEEEERLQQLKEEKDAEEERKEAIRKRKASAKVELEQLKAARELQKKMGQALVRHARESEEKRREENTSSKPQVTSPVAKKSVSFADEPAVEDDKKGQQSSMRRSDWGDVTLGRLRAQERIPLVSAVDAQKYPMKMHVVERHSVATSTTSFHDGADSDDESSSANDPSPHAEHGPPDEEDKSSSNDSDLLNDEPLVEGLDYDAAQHYREIALEYHEKRHVIGAKTAKLMATCALDDDEGHDTLQSNKQSPLSRFQADRMTTAYDESHGPNLASLGHNIIPSSRQKSLRSSVRLGKLKNNQLVGAESGESGSEDEGVREVIQMLRTGSVQNAGPDFNPSSISSIVPRQGSDDAVESTMEVASPATTHGIKPSKFKLVRGGGVIGRATLQDNNADNVRSQATLSGVVERKVPRSFPVQRFPVNKPPPRPPVKASKPTFPMIIDSPSFPMPASCSTVVPSLSPVQDSTAQPRTFPQERSSIEKRVSRFMAEKNT